MNKKIVLIMAALCLLVFSVPAFAAEADVFSDVPANHWSYQAVKKLTQDGIIVGDAGRFNGDKGLTRYEMAVLVGNAMTKIEKADAEQKKLIDKLSREYNAELTKLGARLAKVEAKSKVNFFFDNRIQYNYTSLKPGDKGAAFGGTNNIDQQHQFMERIRMYMNVPVGDTWEWNSRVVQAKFNINNSSDTSFRMDRFWLTGKNILDGKVEIGKMMLYPGKGTFYGDTGDFEGIYYSRDFDKLAMRLGGGRKGTAANAPAAPGASKENKVAFAEFSYKFDKTADLGFYMLENTSGFTSAADYKNMKMFAVNGAAEIPNTGGLALSFEWGKNHVDDTVLIPGIAEMKGGQTGFFVALQSKYKATNYMPALYTSMVNPFVQGDHGWAVSYRRLEPGVAGFANAGAFSWVPLTTDNDGTWQNNYNGVKAWRFDYIYVPWKNVQWTFSYDRSQPLDKGTQGDWTNNSYQSTFNFFF
ncbi:hypothetical protein AXX12_11545 [Anaerosporomusa subterranea]|uniref:SLH domain-containing protein n=1 Tax=Anaerosporomusa subterranea TaxID=1794912 RepID=A0A154BPB7_ANASB|nr:S-layer homology domain-containing protein [Anaerosporomusa subterranea]KYZ75824.1 hypothetical protein AXX12_11545 [Anaerosporomusa subterranea]